MWTVHPCVTLKEVVVSPMSVWRMWQACEEGRREDKMAVTAHLRNAEHAEGFWPKQTLAIKKSTPHLLEGVNDRGRPFLDEQNERMG